MDTALTDRAGDGDEARRGPAAVQLPPELDALLREANERAAAAGVAAPRFLVRSSGRTHAVTELTTPHTERADMAALDDGSRIRRLLHGNVGGPTAEGTDAEVKRLLVDPLAGIEELLVRGAATMHAVAQRAIEDAPRQASVDERRRSLEVAVRASRELARCADVLTRLRQPRVTVSGSAQAVIAGRDVHVDRNERGSE